MKYLFLLFIFVMTIACAMAQQGDYAIEISLPTPSIPLNGTTQLKVHLCNKGAVGNDYVANSLRVLVSMGVNAEIIGINGMSDSRWMLESLGSGTGNAIRVTNKGGTVSGNSCGDLFLDIRGTVVSLASAITANIAFIVSVNPLLNDGKGAPTPTQGNISVSNDNSVTSLAVTSALAPVTLIDFTAKPTNKAVLLDWNYSGDNQFSHFEIKKSIDGLSFSSVDNKEYTPTAAGIASGTPLHFSAVDNKPFTGSNYYKLKMVEKDGSFRYSEILKTNFDNNSQAVSVFPNPVVDIATVYAPFIQNNNGFIRIYDLLGEVKARYSATATTKINIQAFAQGTYLLEVLDAKGERKATLKLLKAER